MNCELNLHIGAIFANVSQNGVAYHLFVMGLEHKCYYCVTAVAVDDQLFSKKRNFCYTGTPPLTRFFGPWKNRVKGKPRYRRSILVLKPQNGEYGSSKSTF